MELYPLGDSAIVIRVGNEISHFNHQTVMALVSYLEDNPFPGMIECVPSFTTVTVFYDATRTTYPEVQDLLHGLPNHALTSTTSDPKTVDIPVCYGGSFGPDLEAVAAHNNLTPDEVVAIHTGGDYLVYMIGFAPGFPYIGGMSEKIAAPRLPSPRLAIPVGSVGIAGEQTGVYPIETPGGWRLIGRTPLALFRPNENPPSLLNAGDHVRFYAVTEEEYESKLEEFSRL
ncbi:5-oxoprolinase subunit PxpB [Alicyclobacillus dauci]|uniref:5-oxoprolinase subunit PxpB n=1 Tax=Alicyclobacillus dauci TaxID=1475485 RepID=A0ABY6Z9K3_9BACL|nr:5-oxoprolinase subunit PxpB [Alicyclobacillus dauci]WAH38765.1 5-oxoprolinase subunit PxpB [Alicyclobacillus dauci]